MEDQFGKGLERILVQDPLLGGVDANAAGSQELRDGLDRGGGYGR